MDDRARALLARTRLHLAAEPLILVRLSADRYPESLHRLGQALAGASEMPAFGAAVCSPQETTLLVSTPLWGALAAFWPDAILEPGWRLITLEQTISLDVSGYLSPLVEALAREGIPALVISAYSTDHLLVHGEQVEAAVDALQRVIDGAISHLMER